MTLHQLLLVLHRWIGLAAGALVLLLALTGALLIFENAIDRALNPATSYVTPNGARLPLETLVRHAREVRPGERIAAIRIPERDTWAAELTLSSGASAFVDPYTGTVLGVRSRSGGLARGIHLLHTRLFAGKAGELIVGWITALTVLMSLTGIVLWWPRKIVGVRRYSSWRRTNFDLHNALGLWASVLIFVISLTGMLIAFEDVTDPIVSRLNGSAAPPARPMASLPQPGVPRLDVDQAIDAAQRTLPGAAVSSINLPARPADIYRVSMKFPEDRTPAGRSRVYLDQFSGAVLGVENTRTAPAGTRILNLKRSAHTGDVFGAPTQGLYFLASLALAGQVISGVLIWWKPRRRVKKSEERSTNNK